MACLGAYKGNSRGTCCGNGQALHGRGWHCGTDGSSFLLVRDGQVSGERITIFEHLPVAGGSLDGAGDIETGYLTRGGRMFEPNFVCTLDLLGGIPAPDNPLVSIRDDILAFNRMVSVRSECRLVRDGCKAEDRLSLSLGAEEIVSLNLLLLTPEARLRAVQSIAGSPRNSSRPISGSCGPPCSRSSLGTHWLRCSVTCGVFCTCCRG